MSEKRPTDSAKFHFGVAQSHSRLAHQIAAKDKGNEGMYKSHVVVAINELADGLSDLTTGIRATYILLEEVKHSSNNRREERNRLMPAKRSDVKGSTPRWD